MSELNTNVILDSISLALKSAFPDRHIYCDEVTQGLTLGDFTIVLVSANQKQNIGTRHTNCPLFDILYYPKIGREECYQVADELFAVLEIVTTPTGDFIRGTSMNFNIVDKVLHFQATYKYAIQSVKQETPMETLEFKQGE